MPAPREAILALARLLAEQCTEDRIAQHCAGSESETIEEGSNDDHETKGAPKQRRGHNTKAAKGLRNVRRQDR